MKFKKELAEVKAPNVILVDRPRVALARLTQLFELPVHIDGGIHATAVIDTSSESRIACHSAIVSKTWTPRVAFPSCYYWVVATMLEYTGTILA